jgi:hypothetical protein
MSEYDKLRTRNRCLEAQVSRLSDAIYWALGYSDFRPREEGEGAFWWRKELRERSGLFEPRSVECSRHPETPADPQDTADCGEGIDRPSPVKSSDVSTARGFDRSRAIELAAWAIAHHSDNADRYGLYWGAGMAAVDDMPDTLKDTAKTSMSEPVPPRTLGGDSDPSHNGTCKGHVWFVATGGDGTLIWECAVCGEREEHPCGHEPSPGAQENWGKVARIARTIARARLENAYGTASDKDMAEMWPQMIVEAIAVKNLLDSGQL